MELLDPNQDPDSYSLPKEVREVIKNNWNYKKLDLMQRIACIELGIHSYKTEQDLLDSHQITSQALVVFKKNNRDQIEKYKEHHKLGKLKLMDAISSRMTYADAYAKAVLMNDPELAKKLHGVLITLDRILPVSELQKMSEILEQIDDSPKEDNVPRGTNLQININSPGAEAQRKLEEIKKAKTV